LGGRQIIELNKMAILRTTVNHSVRGSATLELTPNLPTQTALVDTYSVRLWVHDQLVYDEIQSVHDWQSGHYYVENIAKGFCTIQNLLGQRISALEQSEDENEPHEVLLSPVTAELSTDWLIVYLKATNTNRGELVHASILLRKSHNQVGKFEPDRQEQWGQWDDMIAAWIFCRPEDAAMFGKQLLHEIKEAERMRIELGIDTNETE
jgi:hypothetical protein